MICHFCVQNYLSSARAISTSSEELAQHEAIVDAFANGNGPTLDAKLREIDAEQAATGEYPFSYIERVWDKGYMEARCPNPIHINPSYILNLPKLNNTDRFANLAKVTLSAVAWHHKVLTGRLDKTDVCFSPFGKQLGTARIPVVGRDEWAYHPHAQHIIVFCGSTVFRVDVLDDNGSTISAENLEKAFVDVVNKSRASQAGDAPPLSLLTAGERDEWAQTRAHLVSVGNNAESLNVIDSALLSIAIDGDAASVLSDTSLSTSTLVGNTDGGAVAQPRWFDKHQLLSLESGDLGFNFEHSYSDGMSWNRMISEVAAHVQDQSPPAGCEPLQWLPSHSGAVTATEVLFEADETITAATLSAQQKFRSAVNNLDNAVVDFTDFGKNEIKTWKQSPDAVVQLALMLSYSQLHPESGPPGVYEACSVSRFYHGRTETIRSLTEPAAAFIRAALNNNGNNTLRDLMTAATAEHRNNSVAAASAFGIDRHLLALQLLAKAEGVTEPLFGEELYSASQRWKLSTSNVTADFIKYFAFGPVDQDGYGIGYMINDDAIPMNISSFRDSSIGTDSTTFGNTVRESLQLLKSIAKE